LSWIGRAFLWPRQGQKVRLRAVCGSARPNPTALDEKTVLRLGPGRSRRTSQGRGVL
jgi:hypothetical protein